MAKKKIVKKEVESENLEETAKIKSDAVAPQDETPKKEKRVGLKKKEHSVTYKKINVLVNKDKFYSLSEAIRLAKETSYAKFDATIEAHFNLGIDTTKDDQKIRITVVPPHGTGKVKKILAFVPIESIKTAKEAGADLIGDDAKIDQIAKGVVDFDIIVSDPSFMLKLSKVAKILGPKGLMPNPKSGTVTPDPVKTIKELKKGRVELRSETSAPLLHTLIGKKSFEDQALVENFTTIFSALKSAKPSKTKGTFIQAVTISATMGPGIKVDLGSLV